MALGKETFHTVVKMDSSIDDKVNSYHHPQVEVSYEDVDESVDRLVVEKYGTKRDKKDMARMGKVQQLRVRAFSTRSWLLLKTSSAILDTIRYSASR